MQKRYAADQVKNCYPAFTAQFDQLLAEHVIWQPYSDDSINARYPGGISMMCTRDQAYWFTKSNIIFDVSVEEMAQQRVMRQFGCYQSPDPPRADVPLPPHIHRFNFTIHALFSSILVIVV